MKSCTFVSNVISTFSTGQFGRRSRARMRRFTTGDTAMPDHVREYLGGVGTVAVMLRE